MARHWYIVHTYSGFEEKVKTTLQERIRVAGQDDLFGEILVPKEQVLEMVKGAKKTSERKFFPGYILVNMELNDDTWHTVRSTPRPRLPMVSAMFTILLSASSLPLTKWHW